MTQGCHNLRIGRIGREHRLEVRYEFLHKAQSLGELLAPNTARQQESSDIRVMNGSAVNLVAWGKTFMRCTVNAKS